MPMRIFKTLERTPIHRPCRGQGSVEYMLILSVVLFIVLIAVSLISNTVPAGSSAYSSQYKSYWLSARPFAVLDANQSATNALIIIQNSVSRDIYLRSVTITPIGTSYSAALTSTRVIPPGTKRSVALTNANFPNCNNGSMGYLYIISIVYDDDTLTNIVETSNTPLYVPCG